MIDEVGELFGQSGDAARPRVGSVVGALAVGLVLLGVGLATTVVPGVLVVLAARAMVDKEAERVRNGFLPADAAVTVRRLRALATLSLLVCTGAVFLQGWMVWSGLYTSWMYTLLSLLGVLHGVPDV